VTDGTLQTWNLFGQNGTVEVTLGSTTAIANVLPGLLRIVDAGGADVTSLDPGARIYLRAEVESPWLSPYSPDSLYVSVRSTTTSEEEFVPLVETGSDTGIFQGSLPTAQGGTARYDGTVQVQPGETFEASVATNYGTFADQVTIAGTPNLPP